MMHFLLMIFIMTSTLMFMQMTHPLSMGLMLMIQTLLISFFSGSLSFNFWFSYSLFLIFMGGMLILFMYMTSLASNEIFKFNFNKKIFILMLSFNMFILLSMYLIDFKSLNLNMIKNFENYSLMEMKNFMLMNNMDHQTLTKMFNFPTNMLSILLINYLFLTLIMSVKITNIYKGPLRPSNK